VIVRLVGGVNAAGLGCLCGGLLCVDGAAPATRSTDFERALCVDQSGTSCQRGGNGSGVRVVPLGGHRQPVAGRFIARGGRQLLGEAVHRPCSRVRAPCRPTAHVVRPLAAQTQRV